MFVCVCFFFGVQTVRGVGSLELVKLIKKFERLRIFKSYIITFTYQGAKSDVDDITTEKLSSSGHNVVLNDWEC